MPATRYHELDQDLGQETAFKANQEKSYGSIEKESTPAVGWKDTARNWFLFLVLGSLAWCVLFLVLHGEVLPPGGLFQLLVLLVLAQLVGTLVSFLYLPELFGMLLTGMALRSAGFLHLTGFYPDLVEISRNLALTVILLKAGMGLDPSALRKLKFTVLRLAVLPCIFEACAAAAAANFFFGVPWLWAFLTGFVLSPISPAVVVPTLLSLKKRGYGEDKGIATLVIASSSIDDVLSISVFGVLLASIFSPGGDMTMSLLRGPLELLCGLAGGCIWGGVTGYLTQPDQKVWEGSMVLGLGGLVAVLGSIEFDVPGAGPLLAITASFVANLVWTRRQLFPPEKNPVADQFGSLWLFVQPALFGLIGAEVDLRGLQPNLLLQSLVILLSCLASRLVVCLLCLVGIGLNWKEMVFVNLAWMPKATVQAALSPQPAELLREQPDDPQMLYANLLLTTAVLAIVITAPLGSIGISLSGPHFLNKVSNSQA